LGSRVEPGSQPGAPTLLRGSEPDFQRRFINKKKENAFVDKQINDLDIKVSHPDDPMTSLSGGNQQKVVVGNWLNISPRVIFFDEPSRGVDVNAKQQIFQIIWEQSRRGISSIMVSSELEELLEVCHRILIMKEGRFIREIIPEQISIESLYSICMGGEASKKKKKPPIA
jgi:ribose transport system ATP-binding protein